MGSAYVLTRAVVHFYFPESGTLFIPIDNVHPTMISTWKKALLDGAGDIFDKNQKSRKQIDTKVDELHRQIGQLKVENDFLSRKLGY